MKKMNFMVVSAILLASLSSAAIGQAASLQKGKSQGLSTTGTIDLTPKGWWGNSNSGLPGTGYCMKNPAGGPATKILVAVTNLGTVASTSAKLKVVFKGSTTTTINVPAGISPNGGASGKTINIPASAWKNGQAQFDVYVLPDSKIGDSNKMNNKDSSKCIQPVG